MLKKIGHFQEMTPSFFDRSYLNLKEHRTKIIGIVCLILAGFTIIYWFSSTLKNKKIQQIKQKNLFLRETQLYKGEKGDFYLKIHIYKGKFYEMEKQILGNNNLSKLKKHANFLWSPNGKTFYVMQKINFTSVKEGYEVNFEIKENCFDAFIKMKVIGNQAFAEDHLGNQFAAYKRENLLSTEHLFKMFQTSQINIIPCLVTKIPHHLFKLDDQYVYLEATTRSDYGFNVCKGIGGSWQKYPVTRIIRSEGGGIHYLFLEKGCLYSAPSSSAHHSYLEEMNGQRHFLEKLDVQTFDYRKIGIEQNHLRCTMLDHYLSSDRSS